MSNLDNMTFCYGGCGYLQINNVILEQGGVATFNLTTVSTYVNVTEATVSWHLGSQQVSVQLTTGNVVPSKGQFLLLSVDFNVNWERGVLYDFTLHTNRNTTATTSVLA